MIPAQELRQLWYICSDLLQTHDICFCELDHLGGLGQGCPGKYPDEHCKSSPERCFLNRLVLFQPV